jgi:hypothetical protein
MEYFDKIADFRFGELDDGDQIELFAHLTSCQDCRELLVVHDELAGVGDGFSGVDAETLASVRGRVLDEIRSEAGVHARQESNASIRDPGHSRIMVAAAAVVIAFAGFVAGRFSYGPETQGGEWLVANLESNAETHRLLRDVEDSRDIISNVTIRSVGDGRVAMSFDVSRHVEIVRLIEDPLVDEVLVHAILDQSSLGSRLKAVTMAAGTRNGKVEEALVFSMLEDPDLAVRVRALEILSDRPVSDTITRGLMRVLRHDESMQMRLLAIEVLAQGSDDGRQVLRDFLETDEAVDPAIAESLVTFVES